MPNFNSLEKISLPGPGGKEKIIGEEHRDEDEYEFPDSLGSENLEAGHKEADKIMAERNRKDSERLINLLDEADHEEREKCREEDREDLEKTYKRF